MTTTATSARELFRSGVVIPAHPLALTADRRLDERRQRALTRYYVEAGAGGLAVGVHTTQFAIHGTDLLAPVLELAATTAHEYERRTVLVAGVVGPTSQAVAEAELAASLGYDMVLLAPHPDLDEDALLDRARAVGAVLPVIGFYLQPSVGGRVLSRTFWSRLTAVDTVVGIKVAPFDRYRTLDVLHGVAQAGREDEVSLYTGNDDHILADLITSHQVVVGDRRVAVEFVGGLLGQWSLWVRQAVTLLEQTRLARAGDLAQTRRLLTLDGQLTDANAAIFDSANGFHGCIPGIHEVLRRQGLLAGRWCLDPAEELSPGQLAEIDRVLSAYPWLQDDEFVESHLDRWLS
ncbi:dihydrodipicolinate synthase family protein [Actinophytocola xinjiangensis]|uniref:Dihydrodipicolinate synthase family protein n=1 Tax=Actinophytocola xinjiangensis TaxID=485602 RepID=A0A7Z0WP52_9PSEU|nr:dihydrodipicolinate synthase family protein [Actinophytocola xinjiangensis]OLF10876.1 dihydrodipicolinate synthase family protein [Actinophytocola xinjiangensis]